MTEANSPHRPHCRVSLVGNLTIGLLAWATARSAAARISALLKGGRRCFMKMQSIEGQECDQGIQATPHRSISGPQQYVHSANLTHFAIKPETGPALNEGCGKHRIGCHRQTNARPAVKPLGTTATIS